MGLDFVRIECDVTADTSAQLTAALYNSLRNFEAEFKGLCCPTLQVSCMHCHMQDKCPCGIVFNKKLSSDPGIVRLHQKPSVPFSFYIRGIADSTSSCTIGMVVIGIAINHIGIFHAALLRTVEAGAGTALPHARFTLRSYSLDHQGVRHEITHAAKLPESIILLSGQHILQNTVHSDHARLSLKSPLRLLSNGSIAHRFDFGMFFRSQLRRCSSLCAYYGTGELDLDYVNLSESAQDVAVFDNNIHYAQPQWSTRLNRAGLTGSAECAGLVEPMLSLLILGSYFNAGKGASFGSGFHKIEVM